MAQRQRAGLITLRSQDRNLLPVSFTLRVLQKRVVKLATLNEHIPTPVAQRKCAVKHRPLLFARHSVRFGDGYRLISRRSQDRNLSGVSSLRLLCRSNSSMLVTQNKQPCHRHGAEAARRAHNPEVTRSRRVAGIFHFGCFAEATRQARDIK